MRKLKEILVTALIAAGVVLIAAITLELAFSYEEAESIEFWLASYRDSEQIYRGTYLYRPDGAHYEYSFYTSESIRANKPVYNSYADVDTSVVRDLSAGAHDRPYVKITVITRHGFISRRQMSQRIYWHFYVPNWVQESQIQQL